MASGSNRDFDLVVSAYTEVDICLSFTDAAFRVLDILFKVNVMFLSCYSNSTLCVLLLSLCVIAMWLI